MFFNVARVTLLPWQQKDKFIAFLSEGKQTLYLVQGNSNPCHNLLLWNPFVSMAT